MRSMDAVLKPTLWRTCRVLANTARLRLLSAVIRQKHASVSVLATACRLAPNKASEHLRQLQARGLLSVTRSGRWAFYEATPDPLVAHAAAVLAAARNAVRRQEPAADMVRAFTAFTHPRRIRMVQALSGGPLPFPDLARCCAMPARTARRHADKLRRRGVIAVSSEEGWHLVKPPAPLLHDLLMVALSEN